MRILATTGLLLTGLSVFAQQKTDSTMKTRALKEVVIATRAPIVENKADKIVYNVSNDVSSQGGVAIDVLRKVPQVTVDVDGNVELQGNPGIRFLINGKPVLAPGYRIPPLT